MIFYTKAQLFNGTPLVKKAFTREMKDLISCIPMRQRELPRIASYDATRASFSFNLRQMSPTPLHKLKRRGLQSYCAR